MVQEKSNIKDKIQLTYAWKQEEEDSLRWRVVCRRFVESVSMRYMYKYVTEVRLGRKKSYPAVNLRPGESLKGGLESVAPFRDVLN